jgi:glucosamine-6-phosphate deaminase
MEAMKMMKYGDMQVRIYESHGALGAAAASDLVDILNSAIAERGEASAILATGNSQLSFMEALRAKRYLAWHKVTVFHMDEYLGMPGDHPASFRRYIREKLTDVVRPRAFYDIRGDAEDIEGEMERYASLLKEHDPVACVLGIGENGHLAFNDPPADFHTDALIHVVKLAETCRRQQVGEGHFAALDDVPKRAITLTIPALLRPRHLLAVVPEARKARAVRDALERPVTEECPASILRERDHVTLYLDRHSASLLHQCGRL